MAEARALDIRPLKTHTPHSTPTDTLTTGPRVPRADTPGTRAAETCVLDTPLGPMRAACENGALTGLWFIGQKYFPKGCARWSEAPQNPVFGALRRWLAAYFGGAAMPFNLPDALKLAPRGTDFQKKVWECLLRLPYGETTSYGVIARELALRMGRASMSAQAVGGAVGRNPVSLLIPCHRVLGRYGGLCGYAGGIERKKALLRLEARGAAQGKGAPYGA